MNRLSPRKVQQKIDEFPERLKLIARCGGKPETYNITVHFRKGGSMTYPMARCVGGKCELCGREAPLEPHEQTKRSQQGRLNTENSQMVCRDCHNGQHPGPRLEWLEDNIA